MPRLKDLDITAIPSSVLYKRDITELLQEVSNCYDFSERSLCDFVAHLKNGYALRITCCIKKREFGKLCYNIWFDFLQPISYPEGNTKPLMGPRNHIYTLDGKFDNPKDRNWVDFYDRAMLSDIYKTDLTAGSEFDIIDITKIKKEEE